MTDKPPIERVHREISARTRQVIRTYMGMIEYIRDAGYDLADLDKDVAEAFVQALLACSRLHAVAGAVCHESLGDLLGEVYDTLKYLEKLGGEDGS